MNRFLRVLLCVSLAVFIAALPFLLPSATITEEAYADYLELLEEDDDSDEAEDGEDEDFASGLQLKAIVASAVFSDILPSANVLSLDSDLFSPGSTPIEENFTETGYRDDTIIVELEQHREFDSDVFVAYIKVATPSQIRSAIAGSKLSAKSTSTDHTSAIASSYNAIVAVNGDFFTDTKGGYIVRQGQTVREKPSDNYDLLLIDEMGDFHIIPRGKKTQKTEVAAFKKEHTIVNGFFFGPGLVIDGKVQTIPKDYGWAPNAKNPRAGIAQLGPLTYAIVVVNGRTAGTEGVTMAEFAQIMEGIGAKQAYNLDGGNSATLAFHGTVYNGKPQAERSVGDIIYFASAIDEE